MKHFFKALNATVAATALAASTVLSSGVAIAATQGTLGATSTGSADISVTKATVAQITGLSDMAIASYILGDGNQALFTTACVYTSTVGGSYTVKATGSGAASAFTVANGPTTIPYTVVWNSGGVGALGTTGAALITNVTSATLTNAATDSATCAGTTPGPTAQLNVNFLGTLLDAAPAGTYTGTVTLLITPV